MTGENLKLIRNLKLGISTGEYITDLDISSLPKKWYYYIPKRGIIKYLFENGAVLTGSRALRCYKLNNEFVFKRNPDDWDFLITRDQFIKLCKDHNIYNFNLSDGKYLLNKSIATFTDSYGGYSTFFPCLIQLIIKDYEISFMEKDGIKINSLTDIIESKIDLLTSNNGRKHKRDLNEIILNTYFI